MSEEKFEKCPFKEASPLRIIWIEAYTAGYIDGLKYSNDLMGKSQKSFQKMLKDALK